MDEGNFCSVIEILKKVEETLSYTQSSLHQEKKIYFFVLDTCCLFFKISALGIKCFTGGSRYYDLHETARFCGEVKHSRPSNSSSHLALMMLSTRSRKSD